jgi:tetratricopeptide (TPR) repeat protein
VKGKIYEQQGHYEQALAEFKSALILFGGGANVEALRGHALALAGATEQAQEIAKQLETTSTHNYVSGVDIAEVYCGLRQPRGCHALAGQGVPEPRQRDEYVGH